MRSNHSLLLLLIFILAFAKQSVAEIKWVEIGVDGLTCSLCSRSVEMSLRRLEFVDSVSMSLEKTEGRIYMTPDMPVNLEQIAKAVVNAGFSVRFLRIEFSFKDIPVSRDGSFSYQGQTYQWLDFNGGLLKNEVALKLVDEKFLSRKESSQWKKKLAASPSENPKKVLHVVQQG
jgi:copper chaperone CopZ